MQLSGLETIQALFVNLFGFFRKNLYNIDSCGQKKKEKKLTAFKAGLVKLSTGSNPLLGRVDALPALEALVLLGRDERHFCCNSKKIRLLSFPGTSRGEKDTEIRRQLIPQFSMDKSTQARTVRKGG